MTIEIASDLGEVYWIWKDAEAEKEVLRKKFFDAVTASHSESGLASKTVSVPSLITDIDDATEYVKQYHPGWMMTGDIGSGDNGEYIFLIKEDPSLKSGTEIVILDEDIEDRKGKTHPGYVVTKTIVGGSVLVDTERMMLWDDELYYRVTQWKNFPGVDSHSNPALNDVLYMMDWAREIRGDIDDEDTRLVQRYAYEGPRSVKLNVRYAKPDETPGT